MEAVSENREKSDEENKLAYADAQTLPNGESIGCKRTDSLP